MRILPTRPEVTPSGAYRYKSSVTNIFLTLGMLFCGSTCWTQILNINVDEHHFQKDDGNSLIVCHLDNISTYTGLQSFTRINILFNGEAYKFSAVPGSLDYMNSYQIDKGSEIKTLYFTKLPIVSIATTNTIIDDPKVAAYFVYSDDVQVVTSDVGIELRGGSSQAFPKKTFDLEFWTDPSGADTEKYQFGDLREDDDWILDALYNEPLRLRAHFSHKLWLQIHSPYYQGVEPDAKSGADVEYVELFLNGTYNGLYNLSEQVDKKQLQLKSFKNGEIRGELYKGEAWGPTTEFSAVTSFDNNVREWGGYELKLPDDNDTTTWTNLYNFTDFVVNSSDSDFTADIWNRFLKSNYEDYFIFINLLRATDNFGKNTYLAKYTSGEPYFYVPWDLDGVFGTAFDGTNQNVTNDILRNDFMARVLDLDSGDHHASTTQRWWNHRAGILSNSNLIGGLTDIYNELLNNKIYERESIVYNNYSYGQGDLNYMISWLENRLDYLDAYFSAPNQDDCPDLSISASDLIVGIIDGDCNNPGSITLPTGNCAPGSTMEFRASNSGFWSFSLPVYDNYSSETILARCLCDDDPKFNSVYGSATTNPTCPPPPDCPNFNNISSANLEVGITPQTCDQNGDIHPPNGACPQESTMVFSVDGGNSWTDRLPDFNQQQSITIQARCECIQDPSLTSTSGFVTTTLHGNCLPDCPDFDSVQTSSLAVGVTPKTCDQNGDIHPPVGACPSGSDMVFSIDGGQSWSESLPDYDQDQSITIETKCECRVDPSITSASAYISTNPFCDPSSQCPDFSSVQTSSLEVGITPKTCDQNGDIHPPVGDCPSGSDMIFSIDGGQSWSESLPDYDQDQPITIETKCECRIDTDITSASAYVTTNPDCDPTGDCPDLDNVQISSLGVGITPKTCDQNGDIHPPTGDCPSGSDMVFSIDGGQSWSESLPDYDQDQSITIETKCECRINTDITSASAYVTTNPDCDPTGDCPDLDNVQVGSLEVGITPKTCDQNGDIHPPSGGCPSGSDMLFSIDGGANWTDRLPDYDQDESITILTRCECREFSNVTSEVAEVTTSPGCTDDSECPAFDVISSGMLEVGVTDRTCSQNGDIHPPSGNCPSGSTLRYRILGETDWSERLPDYDQTQSIVIQAQCQCNEFSYVNSTSGYVTTQPESCDVLQGDAELVGRSDELKVRKPTLKIYPNPASDVLTIEISEAENSSVRISMTDLVGRKVAELPALELNSESQVQQMISLDGVAPGIYLLHSWVDGVKGIQKIFVI